MMEHQNAKTTAAPKSFDIGIAEGGARTHDLEVDLFAVIRATRATPARVLLMLRWKLN
jgi:hypothetical protein